MRSKFKSVLAMAVFLAAILLSGCAAKKDEEVQQIPPAPPPQQQPQPQPAPQSDCRGKCDSEFDDCEFYCDLYAEDEWDYEDCLYVCDEDNDKCIANCN